MAHDAGSLDVPVIVGGVRRGRLGVAPATATTQPVDTTAAIDIRQFSIPGPYVTAAVSDTTAWLRLAVYPTVYTGSPAVAADTIVVAMQVSDDRANWSATAYSGPLASAGTTPTSAIVLEVGGSSNNFEYVVRQELGAFGIFAPGSAAATVSAKKVYGFKYIRFLITGDHTGAYAADVTGFVPWSGPTFTSR